jgi:hypothetical protein
VILFDFVNTDRDFLLVPWDEGMQIFYNHPNKNYLQKTSPFPLIATKGIPPIDKNKRTKQKQNQSK